MLEAFVSQTCNREAALAFLCRAMKRYGGPALIVTDRLASYGAAFKTLGIRMRQRCGRWLDSRTENSHQVFRWREGAMARLRDLKSLQRFAAVQSAVHNHFNLERHLVSHTIFKQRRAAALAEWRQLAA